MPITLNFWESMRRADAEYERERKAEADNTRSLTESYAAATDKLRKLRGKCGAGKDTADNDTPQEGAE